MYQYTVWIARDADRSIWLYFDKPAKNKASGTFTTYGGCIQLKGDCPITWESSPHEFRMTCESSDGFTARWELKPTDPRDNWAEPFTLANTIRDPFSDKTFEKILTYGGAGT